MKIIAVTYLLVGVLVLVKGQISQDFYQSVLPILGSCAELVKVPEKVIVDIASLNTDISDSGKCLMACAVDKAGLSTCGQYGDYDQVVEKFKEFFKNDDSLLALAEEFATDCPAKATALYPYNFCEAVYYAYICFRKIILSKLSPNQTIIPGLNFG